MNKRFKNLHTFEQHSSEIIIGNTYVVKEHDIKVIVINKDDDLQKAFVTSDLVDRTGGFWVNYKKLQ